MTVDIRIKCAVCAWRDGCVKKHSLKESASHCPDYVRDVKFGPEDEGAAPPVDKFKKKEDPFA